MGRPIVGAGCQDDIRRDRGVDRAARQPDAQKNARKLASPWIARARPTLQADDARKYPSSTSAKKATHASLKIRPGGQARPARNPNPAPRSTARPVNNRGQDAALERRSFPSSPIAREPLVRIDITAEALLLECASPCRRTPAALQARRPQIRPWASKPFWPRR